MWDRKCVKCQKATNATSKKQVLQSMVEAQELGRDRVREPAPSSMERMSDDHGHDTRTPSPETDRRRLPKMSRDGGVCLSRVRNRECMITSSSGVLSQSLVVFLVLWFSFSKRLLKHPRGPRIIQRDKGGCAVAL